MSPEEIVSLAFKLGPPIVLAFEKIFGEAKAGKDKRTMAKDALAQATSIAASSLTGDNAQYAAIASEIAGEAIDTAVIITRANGKYQAATATAKTLAASAAQGTTD